MLGKCILFNIVLMVLFYVSFTISESIKDMTAYTLLTDSILQTIMTLPKEPWFEEVSIYYHLSVLYHLHRLKESLTSCTLGNITII